MPHDRGSLFLFFFKARSRLGLTSNSAVKRFSKKGTRLSFFNFGVGRCPGTRSFKARIRSIDIAAYVITTVCRHNQSRARRPENFITRCSQRTTLLPTTPEKSTTPPSFRKAVEQSFTSFVVSARPPSAPDHRYNHAQGDNQFHNHHTHTQSATHLTSRFAQVNLERQAIHGSTTSDDATTTPKAFYRYEAQHERPNENTQVRKDASTALLQTPTAPPPGAPLNLVRSPECKPSPRQTHASQAII